MNLHIPAHLTDGCGCPQHRRSPLPRTDRARDAYGHARIVLVAVLALLWTKVLDGIEWAGKAVLWAVCWTAVTAAVLAALYLVFVAAGACAHLGWMAVQ